MDNILLNPSLVLGLTVGGKDVTGFLYDLPLPILIGLAIAAVIGLFGMLGRIKALLTGKGTALDFVTVVLILMVAAIVLIVIAGNVVRSLNVM